MVLFNCQFNHKKIESDREGIARNTGLFSTSILMEAGAVIAESLFGANTSCNGQHKVFLHH